MHFAAQAVMSGTMDLVVAGGVQNMSQIPIMSAMVAGQEFGHETPFANSPGWQARYGDQEVSQFRGAEMIAEKWNISRDDMEAVRGRVARAGAAGARRGPVRERDRPARRLHVRRRTARAQLGEDPVAARR